MCKIMIMSGITDETKENAWAFCKAMAVQMSSPNSAEKDGFGYAAIDAQGNLFGERWVDNKAAFKHQNPYGSEVDNTYLKKYKILSKERMYGNFGVFNENIRSITMHSRSSTNTVSYKNTHPFVEDFTSVIHNGVIHNDDKLTKKTSTCDSEVILHEYIKYNIANRPGKFKKVANRLEGYYALGIFSKTSEGRVILDIIKDNSAKLEAYMIKELNCVVFATPKFNGSSVEDACKTLGFEIISKYEVKANRLQRLDALTGETIAYESFKPRSFTRTTYPANNKWNTDSGQYEYGGNVYPYGNYSSNALEKYRHDDKKFNDVFPKEPRSNIIDMTSHSHNKHEEAVKERQLVEMITANKEYTQEEIDQLVKDNSKIIDNLEKVVNDSQYNDAGESEWVEDDKLTWHKKTIA